MMFIQPLQEFLCIGIHYQFFWEVCFLQQGVEIFVVSYVVVYMGIAAKYDGDFVLLAQPQDFKVVRRCLLLQPIVEDTYHGELS